MTTRQADVEKALTELETMPAEALRARFAEVYRRPPPRYLSRELLVRSIAFHLQEESSRSSDKGLDARLCKLVITLRETGDIDFGHTPPVKPGTRLVREWKGETHEVIVTDEGFLYRDERHQSLSRIARNITGARWSGPRFFGLADKKKTERRRRGN